MEDRLSTGALFTGGFAQHFIEAAARCDVFCEVANGTQCRVEIAMVERVKMPASNADCIHEIFVSSGEYLE